METSKQSLTIKFLEIREIWDENADLKLAPYGLWAQITSPRETCALEKGQKLEKHTY